MLTLIRILIVSLLISCSFITAQNFQGIATYKSHRKVELQGSKNLNEEQQKQIAAQLREQFQQTYTLTFTKNESLYKREEKLEKPSAPTEGIQIRIQQSEELLYKNIKNKSYVKETEILGKPFLIKDKFKDFKWELGSETKTIGNYTCYKAILKDSVTTETFSNTGEIETITKERVTTAWYTPEIPTSNGPENYTGLPGLILEIQRDKFVLVCSKIVMNPKTKIEILEPTKGKVVTQEEFDAIQDKKHKEMLENLPRGKRGDKTHKVIRIGG